MRSRSATSCQYSHLHWSISLSSIAIVEAVVEFLEGELPPDLKTTRLEFSGESAIKPQFVKGQILVKRALERGVVLTRDVLLSTSLHCHFCEEYEIHEETIALVS
jgi:hypothetical protein